MAKTHNKKRNIGIIYEQIIQFICRKALENDEVSSEKAVSIIKEYFSKDTQLNKEHRLFKALAETKNVSGPLANSIIFEAKKACNYMFNNEKLEKEKSKLIKDLNHNFGKGVIFEENIKNYRIYATIQTLLNEWRNPKKADFDLTTKYEIKLHESLTEKENVIQEKKEIPKVDKITYKLMKNIFEKKYSNILNEDQNILLNYFANDEDNQLLKEANKIKKDTLDILEKYIENCNNQVLVEKYSKVCNNIKNISNDHIDKDSLQRYLTIAKLKEELLGGE